MVSIGPVTLNAPFFEAGLAGYSDTAMRLIARRHGCPYCVTEAMLDVFLLQGGKGLKAAELDEADHPIAGQLMGSHAPDMAQGAGVLRSLGYDVIDLNFACPVKKIRKRCRGGHLLSAPDEAIAMLDAVRQRIGDDLPCTVKLRRGSDDSADAEANFHRIFEKVIELGYAAAVVHGRTVEQKYVGPSRWSFLQRVVKQYGGAGNFVIGGSGDIWQAADIFTMIEQTGVQLVSVARGCIGNPWVFAQARALLCGDEQAGSRPPTIFEQRQVLLEHFDLSMKLHGQKRASLMMRKFGIKFSRHHHDADQVRAAFINVKSLDDWTGVIEVYYRQDGPGRVADRGPADATNESCQSASSETAGGELPVAKRRSIEPTPADASYQS